MFPPSKYGPVVQSVSTPACHAGGRRFESVRGRHNASVQSFGSARYASVAQLVEQRTENPRVVGSIPTGGTTVPFGNRDAGVAHPVERHLAKVEVASSSLVTRSIRYRGQVVRQESAKLSLASSNLAGTSKTKRTSIWMSFLFWKNRAVRFEDQKCDCPGISHLPTARRRQLICFCPFPGKNANKSGW